MYKVGIIGTGFSSKVYIPVFLQKKNFEITGICDSGSEKAKKIIKKYNLKCKYFTTAEDLISSEKTNLICIVSPPETHHHYIKLIINQKKNFICEKPLGLKRFSQSKSIPSDTLNIVNYHYRFEKFILLLKKEIKRNRIGEINKIKILWRFNPLKIQNFSWKLDKDRGGGVRNEILSHVFDYIYFLIGDKFKKIEVIQNKKFKKGDSLNEILNLKLGTSKTCKIEILLARADKFLGAHKIFVKGSKFSALISFKFPFDINSKYLKIFKKNKKTYKIFDNKKDTLFYDDDRKNSFSMMLDYIEKDKRHKFLPNVQTSNLIWKYLDKIKV